MNFLQEHKKLQVDYQPGVIYRTDPNFTNFLKHVNDFLFTINKNNSLFWSIVSFAKCLGLAKKFSLH